jgi:hypothetical protein
VRGGTGDAVLAFMGPKKKYDYSYDAVERRQAANTSTQETEEQELERLERQAEEKRREQEREPDDDDRR